ncbi:MAG: UvrB/UvrC motif-containing protein [Armatimonadetes bacterium]|nr:UvrB/UvrC motif-containing protein [Armatimonadota bacterium]
MTLELVGAVIEALEAEMKRAARELKFEEAAAIRDRIQKLKTQHVVTDEEMAQAELKAAFKPKKLPRQKEGIFG